MAVHRGRTGPRNGMIHGAVPSWRPRFFRWARVGQPSLREDVVRPYCQRNEGLFVQQLLGQRRDRHRSSQEGRCIFGPDRPNPQGTLRRLALVPRRRAGRRHRMTSDEPARVFNFPPASLPHAARRRVNRERFCMEGLIVLGILMLVAYAIYRTVSAMVPGRATASDAPMGGNGR